MKKSIINQDFDNSKIEQGKTLLMNHAGAMANNNLLFQKAYKATYSDDYSYFSLKRSKLSKCVCDHANFTATTFSGSTFQDTKFYNCNFANSSLDFCLLYECRLESDDRQCGIINANWGNTNIIQSRLYNIPILKSTVSNTLFDRTVFHGCTIEYSSFENSIFQSCRFENMELRNLNLEFVEFMNPEFDNVTLPFSQIPYIFGLLSYMADIKKSIWIASLDDSKISVDEYFYILPSLIPYYASEQEYFPIANIYIALKEYEKAFEAIMSGMRKASFEKDFRMLKYFCKLAVTSGWCNREKIKRLYDFIYNINNFEPMIDYERHNYYMHLGEFRKVLLFNDGTSPTLHMHLQTNILPQETEKVSLLVHTIDDIINTVKTDDVISSIELHHESPYDLVLIVIGSIAILQTIAKGLQIICEPVKDVQEIIINQQQIKLNQQEIEMNQSKIEEMKCTAKDSKKQLESNHIFINGNIYFTNYRKNKLSKKE